MELATEHLAPPADVHFVPPTASELQLTAFEGSLCLYTCNHPGPRAREREREMQRVSFW